MKSTALNSSEYNSYYEHYISVVGDIDLMTSLKEGLTFLTEFISNIPDNKLSYVYAKDKWSIAEILMHLVDSERVFQHRALRFARNDKTPVPGFDQDFYVPSSRANFRNKESILNEFAVVRQSTIALFDSFNDEELTRSGIASDSNMSVRALGFVICGHLKHHANIIQNKYL